MCVTRIHPFGEEHARRGSHKCKGPEEDVYLICWKHSAEPPVAEGKWTQGRRAGFKVRTVRHSKEQQGKQNVWYLISNENFGLYCASENYLRSLSREVM